MASTSRAASALALAGATLLAFLVRALPFADFLHRGVVAFAPADAMYHVRRAYWTFVGWPSVLAFDPYNSASRTPTEYTLPRFLFSHVVEAAKSSGTKKVARKRSKSAAKGTASKDSGKAE